MIDFDYKIFDLKNYLSQIEFDEFTTSVNEFKIDVDVLKSNYHFFCWSNTVVNKLIELDNDRYERIVTSGVVSYDDFQFLVELNSKYNFDQEHYFNFFLVDLLDKHSKRNKLFIEWCNIHEYILGIKK